MNKQIVFLYIFLTFFAIINAEGNMNLKLDSYLKNANFSGNVLISHKNKVIFENAYGFASEELQVKNNINFKFKIASITKTFTAVAILQLHEKGLLNINDPLNMHVPDFPNGENIKLYNLLAHNSGIFDIIYLPNFSELSKLPTTLKKQIELIKLQPKIFEPGARFEYSCSNYLLLSYIIEKTSGTNFAEYIKCNICDALQINDTRLFNTEKIIPELVSGYLNIDDKLVIPEYLDSTWPQGSGGLYSTVYDLYAYDQALYTNKLLKRETRDLMLKKVTENYALGWTVENIQGNTYVGHLGFMSGFATQLARFVDHKIVIIVLSNNQTTNVKDITENLAKIFFENFQL